jgi:hypothetical protein
MWSIQCVSADDYKLNDKLFKGCVYTTTASAVKAVRDWYAEMMDDYPENQARPIDDITEEYLASTSPGFWRVIYENQGVHVAIVRHATAS